MLNYLKFFLLINNIILICSETDELNTKVLTTESFMFWPNATVPFYIYPNHYDHEQSTMIMAALWRFAFKTCIKFTPVMERPKLKQHIMEFVNPAGIKRCKIDTTGHLANGPHTVFLGYDCLQSPQIDMMIMRALGFPFEHNRLSRDLYINVHLENIENGAIHLYTKDIALPLEMRSQPYDINSVMHFGLREYSKNGHRTISLKNGNIQQNRIGLTATDLKKIELVYGHECLRRDRLEKLEVCQSYPVVERKKRDTDDQKSLRVNPNITPPNNIEEVTTEHPNSDETDVVDNLKELDAVQETQELVEQIYKVTNKALKTAKAKYCNGTNIKMIPFKKIDSVTGIGSIIKTVSEFATKAVENAAKNLSIFCLNEDSPKDFERQGCNWNFGNRCTPRYRPTKVGGIMYSTQHRPFIKQSTKHYGSEKKYSYDKVAWRSRNDSGEATTQMIQLDTDKPENGTLEKIVSSKSPIEVPESSDTSTLDPEKNKEKLNEEPKIRRKRSAERKKTSVSKAKLQKEKMQEKEKKSSRNVKDSSEMESERKYFEEDSRSMKESNLSDRGGPDTSDSEESDSSTVLRDEKPEKDDVHIINSADEEMSSPVSPVSETAEPTSTGLSLETVNKENKSSDEEIKKEERRDMKSRNLEDEIPTTVPLTKLNKEFYHERRWPEGVVRYVISPQMIFDLNDVRSRLAAVARILKKRTCVRLEEVSEDEAQNHEDYLILDTSPDYITGRVGGAQHFGCLELFQGGQHKQHAAMMVMAMLGFYFEVSRHDRDKYIRVHNRHIRPDKLHHFEKIRDEATLNLPYDYESATHPAWQFWRKIGKTGISSVATYKSKDPDGSVMRGLGQNNNLLSDIDIIKINSIYGIECFES